MDCNECIHYKMCRFNEIVKPEGCAWFERREDFVKLPCRIGDPVYSVGVDEVISPDPEVFELSPGIGAIVWDGTRCRVLLAGGEECTRGCYEIGAPDVIFTRAEAEEYRDMLIQKERRTQTDD